MNPVVLLAGSQAALRGYKKNQRIKFGRGALISTKLVLNSCYGEKLINFITRVEVLAFSLPSLHFLLKKSSVWRVWSEYYVSNSRKAEGE